MGVVIILADNAGKGAKETTDDLFSGKVPLLSIGSDGLPLEQRLNPDLLVKDPAITLGKHEKTIWIIILISGFIFASLVFVYI